MSHLIDLDVTFYMHLIRQFVSAHVKCDVQTGPYLRIQNLYTSPVLIDCGHSHFLCWKYRKFVWRATYNGRDASKVGRIYQSRKATDDDLSKKIQYIMEHGREFITGFSARSFTEIARINRTKYETRWKKNQNCFAKQQR